MARWRASAKWAAGPALDGQCATLLGLALSEGLGSTRPVRARAAANADELRLRLWLRAGEGSRSATDKVEEPLTAAGFWIRLVGG